MGYKILLVDDDTELVKMLSKYFERKKYRFLLSFCCYLRYIIVMR